jgi:ribosomal protein L7/L12
MKGSSVNKMDEIIKFVTEKTGLSEEQAKSAIEAVAGFAKEKLPPGIADQVTGFLEGKEVGGGLAGMAAGLKDKLGL